jgi:hypothetical protein
MAPPQLLRLERQKLHSRRLIQRCNRIPRGVGTSMISSTPNNNDLPPCPNCGLRMILIGTLPGINDRPGVEVFRCPYCNAVITREF